MKVIFNLFCFLLLSDFPLLPSAYFARRPGLKWPLTPQLGRLPTPSQWKQLMSNRSEEEDWKDAHKAYQSLKSIRKAPSETLALIDRDLERAKAGTSEPELYDYVDCLKSVRRLELDRYTELYAMKIFDSWGTVEGGFFEGNVRWPGHYYECKMNGNDEFTGKWCMSFYGLIYTPIQVGIPFDITLGMCLPSTCSNAAINYVYRTYYVAMQFPPLLEVQCPPEITWMDIDTVCSVIIGLLVMFLLAGTIYDLLMRYKIVSKEKVTLPNKLLMSFSVISNTEQIIDMKKKPGNIQTLDGIRVITTTWVVLGHVLQMLLSISDNAVMSKRQVQNYPGYMIIVNAFYSVDTFFFISGLLVTYLGLKHLDKTKGFLNVPFMYLQRYLRLTPVYAFAILFHISLYKFLGDGPGWSYYINYNYQNCKDNWWANLLYVNNFYPLTNTCYDVAWYLADDMQMFLLSPVFILLLYHFGIAGVITSLLVFTFSVLYNGLVTFYNDLQPTVLGVILPLSYFYRWYILAWFLGSGDQSYENTWLTDLYNMPWARIHVYMIGVLTGYFLYVTKGKIQIPKIVVIIGWILAAGLSTAVIYGPYVYVKNLEWMPMDLSAFYNAMCRPAFVVAIAWVVIACGAGYGGPVTKLLDWKVFKPLSRLTYSTYIVHIYVLYYFAYTQEKPTHFQTINMTYIYLASLALSFGIGYIFAIAIEWPFAGVCKALFYPSPLKVTKKPIEFPKLKEENSTSEWSSYTEHVNNDNPYSDKFENQSEYVNASFTANENGAVNHTRF